VRSRRGFDTAASPKRDEIRLNRHRALEFFCLSMISGQTKTFVRENRFALFRIML
jgi:hypothetical protein